MRTQVACCVALIAIALVGSPRSHALGPFKKAFEDKYVKNSENEALKAEFKKQACNVCHIKDKKKELVNGYGWELSQAIGGNAADRLKAAKEAGGVGEKAETEKLLQELEAAFQQVESRKSPNGETYGELLKRFALPSAEGEKSVRAAP